jgi:hypothetical protein
MSVAAEDAQNLPPHRRPPALGGIGRESVFVAQERDVTKPLRYRPDPARSEEHGFIEPKAEMMLGAFRLALCDTKPIWKRLP